MGQKATITLEDAPNNAVTVFLDFDPKLPESPTEKLAVISRSPAIRMILGAHSMIREGLGPIAGVCSKCGCTDEAACEEGCGWANDEHTLCSKCAAGEEKRIITL